MPYLYLAIAIIAEVLATSALKATGEFSRIGPSALVVLGYSLSFYFLTLALRTIPVGIAYAVWAGLGIVLISLAGVVLYKENLDAAAIAGIALIVSGVLVIKLFSSAAPA